MVRLSLVSIGLLVCALGSLWIWTTGAELEAELPKVHALDRALEGSEAHFSVSPDSIERIESPSFGSLTDEELAVVAKRDIEGVLNWLSEDADATVFKTAYPIIMHELVRQMPQETAKIVSELSDGFLRDSLVTSISRQWVESDPNAALAWASALEDPSLRGHAQSSVLLGVCELSYGDAVEHVLNLSVDEDRSDLLSKVLAHEIQNQRRNTKSGVRLLDLAESSIEKISVEPFRTEARLEAAQLFIQSHPQVAFALAEAGEVSESREKLLMGSFRSLSQLDPEYASHMLTESTLNDQMKNQLRRVNWSPPVEMIIPKRP